MALGQNPLLGLSNGINFGNTNTGSSVSPQEWEYIQQIRRTGYDQNQAQAQAQQQQQQSDPYNDFESEFSKCTGITQNKILNDDEFKSIMYECDKHIQSMVEKIVRPQVIQTKEGRIVFEKLLATFRQLKDRYSKEEEQNMEKLQMLMQDEVVRKRLMELENNGNSNKGVTNNGK